MDAPDLFAKEPTDDTPLLYSHLRDSDDSVREWIDSTWCRFYEAGLHDRDFANKFHLEFYQRVWELEVAAFLWDQGFSLTSDDEGPDLLCTRADMQCYVECVCPDIGDRPEDQIRPISFDSPPSGNQVQFGKMISLSEVDRRYILRVTGSMKSKAKKFQCYETGLKGFRSELPRIIALSLSRIRECFGSALETFDLPAPAKALYPIGPYAVRFDTENKTTTSGFQNRSSVEKTGCLNAIRNDLFANPDHPEMYRKISGVLYGSLSFSPYSRFQADDFRYKNGHGFFLMHNETAMSPYRLKTEAIAPQMDYWLVRDEAYYYLRNNLDS